MVSLKQAFSILSKSSIYAVSTIRDDIDHEMHKFKRYLYIETETQEKFEQELSRISSEDIIFLCGSSGDGKSELLTRYKKQYSDQFLFHLDGTHSYKPNETAIHALDQRFTEYKKSSKPLIIAINTGMLGNYVQDGDDSHEDIRDSISAFLASDEPKPNHRFIDFSNRSILAAGSDSFATKLIEKITDPDEKNPFYKKFIEESGLSSVSSVLHTNYRLLSNKSVQKQIDGLLKRLRLQCDQFITARAALDFVYELLSDQQYLFDVLFSDSENELLRHMGQFDPAIVHSHELDQFNLQFSLNLLKPSFQACVEKSQEYGVVKFDSAASLLRFMLLMHESFANQEIKELVSQSNKSVVTEYIKIWKAHREFSVDVSYRKFLNSFYRDTLVLAIHRYCNRFAQELAKGQYFLYERNGYKVACDLEIKADFKSIQNTRPCDVGSFKAYFKINDNEERMVAVNVNLLDLLYKINQGYRPNKQDKNAILILDEIVELIREVGTDMDLLYIYREAESIKVVNESHEYYEVSVL